MLHIDGTASSPASSAASPEFDAPRPFRCPLHDTIPSQEADLNQSTNLEPHIINTCPISSPTPHRSTIFRTSLISARWAYVPYREISSEMSTSGGSWRYRIRSVCAEGPDGLEPFSRLLGFGGGASERERRRRSVTYAVRCALLADDYMLRGGIWTYLLMPRRNVAPALTLDSGHVPIDSVSAALYAQQSRLACNELPSYI